jgi:hypothetical protein
MEDWPEDELGSQCGRIGKRRVAEPEPQKILLKVSSDVY